MAGKFSIEVSETEGVAHTVASAIDINSKPTCVIFLGMAGSGKTSLVQRVTSDLHTKKEPPFVINLDPACHEVPYPVNIDIRDTVKYREVMKQYGLGPNGGIVTSLNLFASQFDQLLNILERRQEKHTHVIIDTPGQIEVFTWSASGTIITEALAAGFPTVVVYVMDAVRSVSPVTFMSNMLYACSILYKTRLPFVVAINKEDVVDCSYAIHWMKDFEAFDEALRADSSYSNNLAFSMALVLDDFYSTLKCTGVSALRGSHVDELLQLVAAGRREYLDEYRPEYERLRRQRDEADQRRRTDQLTRQAADLALDSSVQSAVTLGLSSENADDDDEETANKSDDEDSDSFRGLLSQFKSRQTDKERTATPQSHPNT